MKRFAFLLSLLGACASASRAPIDGDRLRAGEVSDNEAFDRYVRYFKAYPERDVRKIDVTDRVVLTIVDRDGYPMSDAPVKILADGREVYRARASAAGQVMFPPAAVYVERDVTRFEAEVDGHRAAFRRGESVRLSVDAEAPARDEIDVDVGFCLDTTGSMGDEIDRIKSTLRDVAARLAELRPRPKFRWGMVIYRDRDDVYVTKRYNFTPNLDDFLDDLSRVRAEAGGDYEEAVNEALHRSVTELDWRASNAIRVLFLIGDAPPHMEYRDDVPYTTSMRRAVESGIKIHSIAASGLNDRGEFIWRQLAQFTMSKFMFISYGGSTPHHVGGYRENNLDDLMVRAVKSEVEGLRSRPARPRQAAPRDWGRGRDPDDFREYQGQQK